MNTCQALSTKYVGKGSERKSYTGPCVLELGHDLDHLTAQEAAEMQFNAAYNKGVDDCIELVQARERNSLGTDLATLLAALKQGA